MIRFEISLQSSTGCLQLIEDNRITATVSFYRDVKDLNKAKKRLIHALRGLCREVAIVRGCRTYVIIYQGPYTKRDLAKINLVEPTAPTTHSLTGHVERCRFEIVMEVSV
jgi:hypothetical protein